MISLLIEWCRKKRKNILPLNLKQCFYLPLANLSSISLFTHFSDLQRQLCCIKLKDITQEVFNLSNHQCEDALWPNQSATSSKSTSPDELFLLKWVRFAGEKEGHWLISVSDFSLWTLLFSPLSKSNRCKYLHAVSGSCMRWRTPIMILAFCFVVKPFEPCRQGWMWICCVSVRCMQLDK